jgi:GNAT superfamily N-acetyltransferase
MDERRALRTPPAGTGGPAADPVAAHGSSSAATPLRWRVRTIEPGDLRELIGLCAEHARYERADFDARGKARRLRRALFDAPARLRAWVADADDRLIGYATATAEFSTWAAAEYLHLDCLFVSAPERGRGIGAALLRAVTQAARVQRLAEMQWQTPEWNADAIGFYRRLGALDQAKRRFVLRIDRR